LREVVCPVLELREEKQTFVKVEGGNVDFFFFFESINWALLKAARECQVHYFSKQDDFFRSSAFPCKPVAVSPAPDYYHLPLVRDLRLEPI
jgi:hypothetical protein